MEINPKCTAFWKTLHINLFSSGLSLSESNTDLLCNQTGINAQDAKDRMFSPECGLTCKELMNSIWVGVSQACLLICPGCDNILPDRYEMSTFVDMSEFYGWENIDILIEDFYMFICMICMNNIITRNLGFTIDHNANGTTKLLYVSTPAGTMDRYKLLFILGRLDGGEVINGLSEFCREVIHTVTQISLLGGIADFAVAGPTLMTSFANAAAHVFEVFVICSAACITIQRAWRTKKRNELVFTLGLVVLRRVGSFENVLDACYKHLMYRNDDEFMIGYDIINVL